ncbi:MAG: hypothetical protein KatS3mg109_0193 [Pirellulaceae bacterium]|uniref:CRISPR-associated protein Csx15 n=1 Tax=Caldilinea sp. TaxID=2293560 RepID=UPI0021DE768F|nr:CRISPR-associated protein Csx15 [uncultured Caldilinea sp.]GIW89761.1 MAG: hypothetical protein KatS3mg109_0193 [Pirellulaceae bacterium]
MIVLNFSHPLNEAQRSQIEALTGARITEVREIPTQFDEQAPFAPQVERLLDAAGLTSEQWQTTPILVVLPSLNFIAAALLAELHGRMGNFPPIVRIRPVAESLPRRYEVAEILDLQAIRDAARRKR